MFGHDAAEVEASRMLDAILSDLDEFAAISTRKVLSEFRARAPKSPVSDCGVIEKVVEKASLHAKAVQFDERIGEPQRSEAGGHSPG